MSTLIFILLLLIGLVLIIWLGLLIKPKPFALPKLVGEDPVMVPLPQGLPAPVERFYRTLYGDHLPVIHSAIFIGRARIRPFGLWLPARFVFVHDAGRSYRHYFEATFFGVPFLRVNEGYIDGESFFESPMGTYHNDANTNQGANLALWAEAGLFPSLWITDPRLRWAEVDENTALLFVPYEDQTENFVMRFDPNTGLLTMMEAMRYREPGEGKAKILWIARTEPGDPLPLTRVSAKGSAIWFDQGKPWAYFTQEKVIYNADIQEYMNRRGWYPR